MYQYQVGKLFERLFIHYMGKKGDRNRARLRKKMKCPTGDVFGKD
jgi:hypothetical protein